MHKATILSLSR